MNRRIVLLGAACALLPAKVWAAMADDDRVRAALRAYARQNLSPLPSAGQGPARDEARAWAALAPLVLDLRARGDCSEPAIRGAIRRALDRDAQAGRFARCDGFAVLATHHGLARLAS